MTRALRMVGPLVLAVVVAALGCVTGQALAQDSIVARYIGAQPDRNSNVEPLAIQGTPAAPVMTFSSAAVGVSTGSAQQLTATFTVSGYTGSFTPTPTLHYGLSYSFVGPMSCTGTGPETCTVTLRFQPQYPGGRRDALFLMNGSTRLATVLLYGVGTAPMALVQPGSSVSTYTGASSYFYQSVTDENGTVWSVGTNVNTLSSLTRTGVFSLISVTGLNSPATIGIDGAGVLYIANGSGSHTAFVTYDTVQGVQGTFTLPTSVDVTTVGVGNTGNIYGVDTNNDILYTITPSGSSTSVTLVNGSTSQADTPLGMAVDSSEDLFFGGYWTINEYSSGGVQSTLNPNSSKQGIAVDPAETVYAGGLGNTLGGVVELAAANYGNSFYVLPNSAVSGSYGVDGVSLGPDGTVNDGIGYGVMQFLRSSGALTFTAKVGVTTAVQNAGIYNGGNQPLTITNIALTGSSAFVMSTAASNNCTGGIVLQPGTFCQVALTYTSAHAGSFTGAVTFTSNSLNNSATTTAVALTATTNGVYGVPSPAGLTFSSQTINTTSGPQLLTVTNQGYGQNMIVNPPSNGSSGAVAGFTVSAGTCTSAVAVGATCQLSVTFTPTTPSAYSGTVTVGTQVSGGSSGPNFTFTVAGQGLPGVSGSTSPLVFNPAPVNEAKASAQTITASYTITGYSSLVTPIATMHYGTSYSVGTVACTGAAGNQTCTMPVTFLPIYPGGRRDALFLTVGGVRIATVLAYGVGQSPFALIQPGVVTNPILQGPNAYYTTFEDENLTSYVVETQANAIISVTKAGVVTTLPITGLQSPRGLGIDGAGVLYVADQKGNSYVTTYDTVQGVQGQIPFPTNPAPGYIQDVKPGNTGNVYLENSYGVYTLQPNGATTYLAFSPVLNPAPSLMATDSADNIFLGGSAGIYEIPYGASAYTQVNSAGSAIEGLSADAADSLYPTRYQGFGPVYELPASNYGASQAVLDPGSAPLGGSVGPDGTLYVGNDTNLDKVDRSQGAISFGASTAGTPATQTDTLYNGGNTPLNITALSVTGAGYSFATGTNLCTVGVPVAPGGLCNIGVTANYPNAGNFPGTITIATNSLNVTTTQQIALTGTVHGFYITVAPTPLTFPAQTATTSKTQTITLSNNGYQDSGAINGGISSTNPAFTGTLGTCSGVYIGVGQSCQINVTFTPTAATSYSGTISWTEDDGYGQEQIFTVPVSGNGLPLVTATNNLIFNPAPVAEPVASAQTIVAAFTITDTTSLVTPTAAMHYGINYSVGTVSCTGAAGAQSCTVPVTFLPIYPGGRKDALVISSGSTTLGTIQAYGVGQGPFALIDGGVITSPITNDPNYLYGSTVGEDGTVYVISGGSAIQSVTKAGVVSTLPITGISGPAELAIDGAGTLYISNSGQANSLITYSAGGVQGTYNISPPTGTTVCQGGYGPETYPIGVATGIAGDIYILDAGGYQNNGCPRVDYFKRDGTSTGTPLNPSITQPDLVAVDSSENVFVSGYTVNEIPVGGGTQSQINSNGAQGGLGVDAAATLYLTRYNGLSGVAMVPASNYAQAIDSLDGSAPLGSSIGPDGTVYVSQYQTLDKVDRSQGSPLAFGAQNNGSPSTQSFRIYNGGNQPLTISNFAVSGAGFSASTGVANSCSTGLALAPGALCTASVTFLPTHSGTYTGSVSFTTNTLNASAATQTVALSGYVNGIYVTATPNPLNFGNQTVNTTSAAQTITLTNNGVNANAGIGPPSSVAGFNISQGTCTTSLAPGASCNLSVTFTPTAAQTYTGSITTTEGSSASTQTQTVSVTVNGTGVPAAAPAVTLAPTSVSFGSQTAGTASAVSTVVLTNSGTATLAISGITLTGTNASAFALPAAATNPCGATLAASASCNIAVIFAPATPGAYTASISVADNAVGTPQVVALTGTGTMAQVAQLQFTPSLLNIVAGTGTGSVNDTGDGGPAVAATFDAPINAVQDAAGNVYVVDQADNYVRKFTVGGNIVAFAGVPSSSNNNGYGGDGGQATAAKLSQPIGIALDAAGNVYIGDYANGRIRKVTVATGIITTYAGNGTGTFTGGPALSTALPGPTGIAFDPAGNLYIACTNASLVIKVTPGGTASVFAGKVAVNGSGTPGYNGDNIPANTAELNFPDNVATDAAGNIYIADTSNARIREVSAATGTITTIAGNGTPGSTGDGAAATSAEINAWGVGTDLAGDVLISSYNPTNNVAPYSTIRKVDVNGKISTIVGGGSGTSGGPATAALLRSIGYAVADNNGSVLIPAYYSPDAVLLAGPNGSLVFGNQNVGTTSAPLTVTFENTGNATLTLSQTTYTATGNFAVSGGTCIGTGTLTPGATCTLLVTFTPQSPTTLTGSIAVLSNGTAGAQTIGLQGTGVVAAASQAVLTPNVLNFGNTQVGTTSPVQAIALSNPGTAVLNVSSIVVGGANAGSFSQTNNCGATVAIGGSCMINVSFTPGSAAALAGTIVVTDDAANSPQTATLTGTGTAPQAVLTPTALTFTGTLAGTTSAVQTIMLSNPGTAALSVTGVSITGTNASSFAQTNNCGTSVAAAGSCTISVTFSPGAAGSFTASVSVADSATGSPQTAPLTGTGTAPQAVLTPTTLTFANTTVGTTTTAQTISLSNPGTAALSVTGISITGTGAADFAQTNNCGATVAAGGSCTISVTFTPLSAASLTATVSVADSATGSPQTAALSGTGTPVPAPQAVLTPTTLAFPSTTINTTSAVIMTTLSNPGNAVLNISGITIGGANPGDFAISAKTCGASLAASASCTISVTFTPLSTASFAATLNVADNATGSPQTAALTGTGTPVPAPIAGISPAALAFGNQTVSTASAAQTLTVSNTGNAALTISGITLGGSNPTAFAVSGGTCGASVAAGASCTIAVTFTPTSVASFAATVSVANNAAGSPLLATLTGTGTAVPAPVATLTPSTITFATTNVGTTAAAQTLTLANTGNAPLTIAGVTIGGANAADFGDTTTCGTSLAAGSSCTIAVTFTPASAATFTATVNVADNAAGSPQTATVSGTGVGVGDFTVTAATGSASVQPGALAQFSISVASLSGSYSLPVVLSVTGLPAGASASFNPASVVPGSSGAASLLTVQTPTFMGAVTPPHDGGSKLPWLSTLLLLPPLLRNRRLRRRLAALPLSVRMTIGFLILGSMVTLTGCGSGGYFGPTPQTVNLTVTGTSGTLQHSTVVSLTIQ